ncbi:unnamed protein product [Rhizophagus irregularis]|nr:unnamed protein product [Rhizophagus irregularis]CAB4428590.1 unnamed protein product [Rhizophagus irregularis]
MHKLMNTPLNDTHDVLNFKPVEPLVCISIQRMKNIEKNHIVIKGIEQQLNEVAMDSSSVSLTKIESSSMILKPRNISLRHLILLDRSIRFSRIKCKS